MAGKKLESFSPMVCQKLRNLVAARKRAKSKRGNLFKSRDAAKDSLDKCTDGEQAKKERCLAEYGLCVIDIARYDRAIKKYDDELDEAVENADNDKLFDDPDVDEKEYLDPTPVKKDDRPVGGPSATKPPKAPPRAAKPQEAQQQADGVEEHLAVSCNELDLPEKHKGILVTAGVASIKVLAEWMDKAEFINWGEKLDCSVAEIDAIKKAVAKYRKAHFRAQLSAEGIAKG